MTYGHFEMQQEDENAREDAIAIMSGNMCAFCLSTLHSAGTANDCPRNVPCLGCDTAFIYLNADQRCDPCHAAYAREQDTYWKQQEQLPDFTCAVCKTPNYSPHEGQFFVEKYEPGTLCQTCMLRDAGAIS